MKTNQKANKIIWDKLYKKGRSVLLYPDSHLVRLTHHLLRPGVHKHVLDYGFGSGSNLLFLAGKGFKLSGVEVSAGALEIVRKRLRKEGLSADIKLIKNETIPFENGSFDAVIAWQVLYYNDWDSLAKAVSEINRVLRPGGQFIGTMAAPGDVSNTCGKKIAGSVFESKVKGQEGAVVMIPRKGQLKKCFPNAELTIGRFNYSYDSISSSHWIITYRKLRVK